MSSQQPIDELVYIFHTSFENKKNQYFTKKINTSQIQSSSIDIKGGYNHDFDYDYDYNYDYDFDYNYNYDYVMTFFNKHSHRIPTARHEIP